jgi:hypothetical protein
LQGYRALAQHSHQELLAAVDVLVEQKLVVIEASEYLYLWLTQRGVAALDTLETPGAPPSRSSDERSGKR